MGIYAVEPLPNLLAVGDLWVMHFRVRDLDGYLVDQAPTVTVTSPSGVTAASSASSVDSGFYRVTHTLTEAGRWVARAATEDYGLVDLTVYAELIVTGSGLPTLQDVSDYLGSHSATEETLQDALDAEAAAQRARCDIPATYPADLRQALLRRIMRNLAMRRIAYNGTALGDAEVEPPAFALGGNDPEVRRLEAPYRRLVVG